MYKVRANKREDGGYNLSYGKGSKKIECCTRKDPSNNDKWFVNGIGYFTKLGDLKTAWGKWAAEQYNGSSKANGESVQAAQAPVPLSTKVRCDNLNGTVSYSGPVYDIPPGYSRPAPTNGPCDPLDMHARSGDTPPPPRVVPISAPGIGKTPLVPPPPPPIAPRRKQGNGIIPAPPEGVEGRRRYLADENNPLFRYPVDCGDSELAGKETPLGLLLEIQDWHDRYKDRVAEINHKLATAKIPGFNPFSFLRLMIDECVEREIPQESDNEL